MITVEFYLPPPLDWVLLGAVVLAVVVPLLVIPKRLARLLRLLRPLRLIHYAGFAAGGAVMAAAVTETGLDFWLLLYSCLAALIAFQGAVFLNDIFDAEIDSIAGKRTPFTNRVLGRRGSYVLAGGLSAFSLVLALRCGAGTFLLLSSAHLVSLLYSVPPLRLKRFYPLNVFLLALAGLAVMGAGFSSHASLTRFPVRMAVLVLVTLTATFGTKDISDVEGDRRRGIRTLFTLLGTRKGRWVNAGLVLASYLITPLILAYPKLYIAAAPAGAASAVLLLVPKNREWAVLLLYVAFGLLILYLIVAGELF